MCLGVYLSFFIIVIIDSQVSMAILKFGKVFSTLEPRGRRVIWIAPLLMSFLE